MDLIKINENKLKIMLTPVDLQCYDINTAEMDYTQEETRQAFRHILDEARDRTGFDAGGNRIYIQLYPSREGGCELFITKLGVLCTLGEGEDGVPLTKHGNSGVGRTLPIPRPQQERERGRSVAFVFEKLDHLLTVCRRLSARAYPGGSAAYRGEEGRYFLLLSERGGNRISGIIDRAALSLISEYGIQQNADAIRLYIREHARPICESRAIEHLAQF